MTTTEPTTTTRPPDWSAFRVAVIAAAAEMRPTEWASFADVAVAAGYTRDHAVAVGDVWDSVTLAQGLPHVRVFRADGTPGRSAPDWVIAAASADGVRFIAGHPDARQRVGAAELRRRYLAR